MSESLLSEVSPTSSHPRVASSSLPSSSSTSPDSSDWLLWQLADSGLPTGGFVASAGLEAAFQLAHVQDPSSLDRFVRSALHACLNATLPFIFATYVAVEDCNSSATPSSSSVPPTHIASGLRRLMTLDDFYDACNPNEPLRRASKAQGIALLTVYEKSLRPPVSSSPTEDSAPVLADRCISDFKREIRKGNAQGHAPVCFGLMCAATRISLVQSYRLFLFLLARSIFSAAVRLGVPGVGPYAAQKFLATLRHPIESIVTNAIEEASILVDECREISLRDRGADGDTKMDGEDASEERQRERSMETIMAWLEERVMQTSPLVDLWQGCHDRLFARLFWT